MGSSEEHNVVALRPSFWAVCYVLQCCDSSSLTKLLQLWPPFRTKLLCFSRIDTYDSPNKLLGSSFNSFFSPLIHLFCDEVCWTKNFRFRIKPCLKSSLSFYFGLYWCLVPVDKNLLFRWCSVIHKITSKLGAQ